MVLIELEIKIYKTLDSTKSPMLYLGSGFRGVYTKTQMYQVILGSLVKLLSYPTITFLLKGGKGGFAKI
jgi:hypothetical protein